MKKTGFVLLPVFTVLALASCAQRPTSLPPGEYTQTHKSTTAEGTEVERTTRTQVYHDAQGNKRAVEETETSRDPAGLFNKSTSTSVRTYN